MGTVGDAYDCEDPPVAFRSLKGSLLLLSRVA
jgi:hypothetical protein